MIKKVDFHTHTSYSFDGTNTMEEMVKAAIKAGVSELAFTDHSEIELVSPLYQPPPKYEIYKAELDGLREKYADEINIIYGIEISLFTGKHREISDVLAKEGFEFIIGSIHDIAIGDIYSKDFCVKYSKKEVYQLYFEAMLENIKGVKNFDVLGHMDYIERYANGGKQDFNAEYSEYAEIIDEIFKILIEEGKGIEINSSGFRYGLDHAHPGNQILQQYKNLGGEIITIGSDAHKTEHICDGFEETLQTLREVGFKAFTIYKNRKPIMVDLP